MYRPTRHGENHHDLWARINSKVFGSAIVCETLLGTLLYH